MRPGQEWNPRSPMNLWHIFLPLWVQENLLYILSLTGLGSVWPLSCGSLLNWEVCVCGTVTVGMETVRKRRWKCVFCLCCPGWRSSIKSGGSKFPVLWVKSHTEVSIQAGRESSEEHPLPASGYHLPSPFSLPRGLQLLKPEKVSVISPWFFCF